MSFAIDLFTNDTLSWSNLAFPHSCIGAIGNHEAEDEDVEIMDVAEEEGAAVEDAEEVDTTLALTTLNPRYSGNCVGPSLFEVVI